MISLFNRAVGGLRYPPLQSRWTRRSHRLEIEPDIEIVLKTVGRDLSDLRYSPVVR